MSAPLELRVMGLNHHQQKGVNWTRALPEPVNALHTMQYIVCDAMEHTPHEKALCFLILICSL